MTVRKILLTAAAAAAVASTGACVSLFPKSDPSQLYRFGVEEAPAADLGARGYNVTRTATVFNRAATGDRILTVTGSEVAYVAQSRWVAPAVVLFDEAAARSFDAAPGCARLLTRGDSTPADAVMRLEVRSFEVQYRDGPEAAPTAVVEVHASMTRTQDREVVVDRAVRIEERASDNRVSAIVAALDSASSKALGEIAGAVNGQAAQDGCGTRSSGARPAPARPATTAQPR